MTITKEGALTSFYTVNKAPIKHLKVYFSPKQAGTGDPSPDNVREISGWNSIELYQTGTNVWDETIVPGPLVSDGTVAYSAGTSRISTSFIPIKGGLTYYLHGPSNAGNGRVAYYDVNKTPIYVDIATGLPIRSFTPNGNACYMRITTGSPYGKIYNNDISINYPNTDKAYHSYTGQTHTLDWTNEVGTVYGGYIDLITGEFVQEYGYIEANWGDFTVDKANFTNVERRGYPLQGLLPPSGSQDKKQVSNIAIYQYGYLDDSIHIYVAVNNIGYVFLPPDTSEDTRIQITYKLATPITCQLTSTQLSTLIGRNNIWSNADRVEVEYDLAESNDELYRRRNIILQGAPHLETATGDIANFNTDLIAPIKDAKIYFNPVQEGSGDPSPNNVRPITGWTGVNVQHTEKNIFDKDNPVVLNAYIDNNKNITSSSVSKCVVVKVNGSTQYTVKKSAGTRFAVGDSPNELPAVGEQTLSLISNPTETSITITTNVNAKSLIIWCHLSTSDTLTFEQMIATLQVEQSAVSTIYNQYTGITIPITFPALGKNLLNPATLEQGGIAYNGPVFNASNRIRTGFIPVKAGKKYTASATGFIAFMHFYDAEKGNISENVGGVNITAPEGAKFVRCGFRKSDDADIVPSDITDSQLEEGSTATSYEPYTNTIYGGYVDLVNGELVRDWLINTHEIKATDGTPGGAGTGNNTDYRFIAWNLASAHLPDSDRTSQAICNIAPYNKQVGGTRFWIGSGTVYMILPNDNQSYTAIIAYAERALNISKYQLTPIQLKTLKSTNNIWSNANGPVSITYWTH